MCIDEARANEPVRVAEIRRPMRLTRVHLGDQTTLEPDPSKFGSAIGIAQESAGKYHALRYRLETRGLIEELPRRLGFRKMWTILSSGGAWTVVRSDGDSVTGLSRGRHSALRGMVT